MSSSYQVFARKYRPLTFKDVLGQDHVIQTLTNAIAKDRLAHAYLFVGPRGTGKTSTARILAKALNCDGGPKIDFDPTENICQEIAEGRCLDVIEIDGASNNGVEQVRELRDNVKFAPSHGRYKIYYIDEVHMLSNAAFNALLKTLEEPPEHVKFIFATTEVTKILPTIISRCQRFDLRRIPTRIISDQLNYIAKQESITLDPVAATAIAKGAEGGMRDAQSMLDQLVAFCGESIQESDVLEVFGFTGIETVAGLGAATINKETVKALETIYEQSESGKDLSKLLTDFIGHLRSILVYQVDPAGTAKELAPEILDLVKSQSENVETDRLLALIDHFATVEGRMKWAPNKRLHLEIGIIKAVQILAETRLSDVISVIDDMISEMPLEDTTKARHQTPQNKSKLKPETTPEPQKSKPNEEAPTEKDRSVQIKDISEKETQLSGTDVWAAVIEHISQVKSPFAGDFAAKGVFQEDDGEKFVVAMSPNENIAHKMITSEKLQPIIEKCLGSMLGARKFQVEIKEGVKPPELPPHVAELEEPSEESSPSDQEESKQLPDSSTKEEPEEGNDIYDDPLIREALEVFEAVIKED